MLSMTKQISGLAMQIHGDHRSFTCRLVSKLKANNPNNGT